MSLKFQFLKRKQFQKHIWQNINICYIWVVGKQIFVISISVVFCMFETFYDFKMLKYDLKTVQNKYRIRFPGKVGGVDTQVAFSPTGNI